jgi:hypothetical protein
MATDYRRTPLPKEACTPLGWLAFWVFLLVFSPFFGFAIHGKVDEAGLMIGLAVATVPLVALSWLVVRRWNAMRVMPRHILEEWQLGRVVAAEGAPMIASTARFVNKKNWIEFRSEGVVLSSQNFLGAPGTKQLFQTSWVVQQSGQLFISWNDVVEWIVDSGSDGPDYYRLKLHQGEAKIRRFRPEEATECDLLDAVRGVGRVPVRLLCDVECE